MRAPTSETQQENLFTESATKIVDNAPALDEWGMMDWTVTPAALLRVGGLREGDVLCPLVLTSLRELDEENASLVNDLGQLFLSSVPELLRNMCNAFENGNLKLTKRIVHQIASSSGNIGALRLSQLAKQLEAYKGSVECQEGSELILEILREYALVKRALKEEMSRGF